MTSQNRLLIELSDILSIEIACKACGSSVGVPLNAARRFPTTCPNCNADWFGMDASAPQPLQGFVDVCKQLSRVIERYGKGVGLRLEVKQPEDATRSDVRRSAGQQ